jgi:hypothetical protein
MRKIILHRQFIADLLDADDKSFITRVIKGVFAESTDTANDRNDHRYGGVSNAWIRYVSRGRTAYRIIYLKQDGRTIFWRCGQHSVEDRLLPPLVTEDQLSEVELTEDDTQEMPKPLTLITTHRYPLLYSAILGRRLIPNKKVYLISPFIDPSILLRGTRIGQTLDAMVADGAEVYVITGADQVRRCDLLYKDLLLRDIELTFLPKLHAKIYLFITNEEIRHITARTPSLGIIGSSNLTSCGVPNEVGQGNLEVNYAVDTTSIGNLEDIVVDFYCRSQSYGTAIKAAAR